MSEENIKKVNEEDLEKVSGGTNAELNDIKDALGAKILKEIIDGLNRHGVIAELSGLDKNRYTDRNTGKELSHEEVFTILKTK